MKPQPMSRADEVNVGGATSSSLHFLTRRRRGSILGLAGKRDSRVTLA